MLRHASGCHPECNEGSAFGEKTGFFSGVYPELNDKILRCAQNDILSAQKDTQSVFIHNNSLLLFLPWQHGFYNRNRQFYGPLDNSDKCGPYCRSRQEIDLRIGQLPFDLHRY